LANEYFGHNGSLPAKLRDWLERRASELSDSNGLVLTLQDFSIPRASKVLTVRSLSPAKSAEHRLLLTESNAEPDAQPLQALNLTKREAEVLLWISRGKRNGEIAAILETSNRTVGKHTHSCPCSIPRRLVDDLKTRKNKESKAPQNSLKLCYSQP